MRDDLPIGLLTDITLDLIATVDHWFAMNATILPKDEEAELSMRAFTLLMAPLLPPAYLKGPLP